VRIPDDHAVLRVLLATESEIIGLELLEMVALQLVEDHGFGADDLAFRLLGSGCITSGFLLAVDRAGLHDYEVTTDPVYLQVHGLAEQLQPVHGIFARFSVLFDFVLDPFQQEVEFPVDGEQRVVIGNIRRGGCRTGRCKTAWVMLR
jgi:hypothetical protein